MNKKSKWLPPNNWKNFFSSTSDVDFKNKHPLGYYFLIALGIIALFLPIAIFLFFVRVDSPWMMLGFLGSFIIGIGLFNFVAIIIDQYMGHLVSILSFLLGVFLIIASYWIC